jgi:hypothetical protein
MTADDRLEGATRLHVTEHARERWFQRSSLPGADPADAWIEAVEIHGHGLEADDVRHHAPSGTVLVRKNRALVTVIEVDTAKPSVQIAVHHFGGESV